MCVVATDPDGVEWSDACAPNAVAVSEGLFVVAQCEPGQAPSEIRIAGVLPDELGSVALRRRGTTVAKVDAPDNGYALRASAVDELLLGVGMRQVSRAPYPPAC